MALTNMTQPATVRHSIYMLATYQTYVPGKR